MQQWKNGQRPFNTTLHHSSDRRTLASNSTRTASNASWLLPQPHMTNKSKKTNTYSMSKSSLMRSSWVRQLKTLQWNWMEKVPQNFEQLQDLIRKECDKRDRKYAWLEDKCNKWEQQVTQKDHQETRPQRSRSPNHEEPGASKKNKSNQRNAMNQQRTCPKAPLSTTLAQKTDETLKAQDKPPKKTAVPGQKMQTNLHRPCKTNQIRIRATMLARKNHQGSNNERTNFTIRIRR